jgi:hypothetical protein
VGLYIPSISQLAYLEIPVDTNTLICALKELAIALSKLNPSILVNSVILLDNTACFS